MLFAWLTSGIRATAGRFLYNATNTVLDVFYYLVFRNYRWLFVLSMSRLSIFLIACNA